MSWVEADVKTFKVGLARINQLIMKVAKQFVDVGGPYVERVGEEQVGYSKMLENTTFICLIIKLSVSLRRLYLILRHEI